MIPVGADILDVDKLIWGKWEVLSVKGSEEARFKELRRHGYCRCGSFPLLVPFSFLFLFWLLPVLQ